MHDDSFAQLLRNGFQTTDQGSPHRIRAHFARAYTLPSGTRRFPSELRPQIVSALPCADLPAPSKLAPAKRKPSKP